MSSDLYEVLSLAARYLFTLLGVLIVLRAFIWLLQDRADRRLRLRSLPDAGMIGELVVLAGSIDLSEGTVVPVPWEGVMGSVRSCDLYIPCEGIRKRHLSFSFQPGKGLLIHPCSGCEARVNDVPLTCRSREDESPMVHGSFLQVGSALLRLRLFAGLDQRAGFDSPEPVPDGVPLYPPSGENRTGLMGSGAPYFSPFPSEYQPADTENPANTGYGSVSQGEMTFCPAEQNSLSRESYFPEHSDHSAEQQSSVRQKHNDRNWEADWSE